MIESATGQIAIDGNLFVEKKDELLSDYNIYDEYYDTTDMSKQQLIVENNVDNPTDQSFIVEVQEAENSDNIEFCYLIPECQWTEYAKELLEDDIAIQEIECSQYAEHIEIDWDGIANDLGMSYTLVDIGDEEFYIDG